MLIKAVKDTIEAYGLFEEGENILIGVSGGHDSVALLHILREISKDRGYRLHIAHVNHGVRGAEADGDEDYVRKLAETYGFPFYVKKADMNRYAKERGLSSEEAGREIRYSFFREILKNKLKSGKIAVAHNKNDQAETVIMRIMRGTGIDGLKGMDFANGDIARPLLDIARSEIEMYCEEKGLEPRVDRTNFENIYSRNKVRLELIPYIESNFNPNITETLCRMSEVARRDSEFLQSFSEEEYARTSVREKNDAVVLDNGKFKSLDIAIRHRVARLAVLKVLGNLEGLEEKHLRVLAEFSDSAGTGKSIDLFKGIKARLIYGQLHIEKSEKKPGIRYNYKVEIGERLEIKEIGAVLDSRVVGVESIEKADKDAFSSFFDYDKISGDIFLRNRLPGDKVKFLGMNGRKKLKDYFIDEKIPRDERERVPLLEVDGEIAWIVGHRSTGKAKVTPETKRVLVLEYLENKEN